MGNKSRTGFKIRRRVSHDEGLTPESHWCGQARQDGAVKPAGCLDQEVGSKPEEPLEFPRAPLLSSSERSLFPKTMEASQDEKLEIEMQTGESHQARLCLSKSSCVKRPPRDRCPQSCRQDRAGHPFPQRNRRAPTGVAPWPGPQPPRGPHSTHDHPLGQAKLAQATP